MDLTFDDIRPLLMVLRNKDEAGTMCAFLLCYSELNAYLKLLNTSTIHHNILKRLIATDNIAAEQLPVISIASAHAQRIHHQSKDLFQHIAKSLEKLGRFESSIRQYISQHEGIVKELDEVSP